jgi:membrane protein
VLAAIVVVPVVLNLFGWGGYSERLLALLRWPGLFFVIAVGLTIVYRYGPSRRPAKWRWITSGSAIAASAWIAASMLFSWYVSNFDSYNRMYGSLGAVVGFQIWLWLSSVIVLLGAEFNAETSIRPRSTLRKAPRNRLAAGGPRWRIRSAKLRREQLVI